MEMFQKVKWLIKIWNQIFLKFFQNVHLKISITVSCTEAYTNNTLGTPRAKPLDED